VTSAAADVTVVIASRDRPARLRRCLDALSAQRVAATEVIVVDDGSRCRLDEVTAGAARLLRHPRATGQAGARNTGWRAAETALVAFTDDDCRPEPGWLAALTAASGARRVVVGRTVPDPDDGAIASVLDRTMRVDAEDGRFSTCNVLYPRSLLEELGGFRPAYRADYGEDTDLGQRALEAGAEAVFIPAAVVRHAVHRLGLVAAVRDHRRVAGVARLLRDHPGLRSGLADGLFWRIDHRYALTALAGMALLPVTPAGLAAVGRWVDHAIAARLPRPAARGIARELAALAVLDATELLACAAASARHRTLLL
jgi:glycosyltransferase involved in cell wall biosynthesis